MEITLNNFRTLAHGTENLGFVRLTHENGADGIDKANNYKHRTWRNRTSEAASADNLVVRQKLLQAFTDVGAGTAFLRDLRTRLGLDNPQTTAAILTRNELREIFNVYDDSQNQVRKQGRVFDGLAEAYIPDAEQRAMLGEQLRLLKGAFVDARMAAQTIAEDKAVLSRFADTLKNMRAAFPVHPQPVEAHPDRQSVEGNPLREQDEALERIRREIELTRQHDKRLEKFQKLSREADKIADADILKIRHNIKTLPNFSDTQCRTILDVITDRVYQLRPKVYKTVKAQMVDRNEIDGDQALYQLKKGWLNIEQAVSSVLTDLCVNGVDEAKSEGELLRDVVLTKLQTALGESA